MFGTFLLVQCDIANNLPEGQKQNTLSAYTLLRYMSLDKVYHTHSGIDPHTICVTFISQSLVVDIPMKAKSRTA